MENTKREILNRGGLTVITITGLCMFLNGLIHTNGINILYSMLTAQNGWEQTTLLNMNTAAGIIGVLFSFLIGRLIIRFGAKWVGSVALCLNGLFVMWFGRLSSLTAFFICMVFLWCASDAYGQLAPFTLNENWFPNKKGIALGISTMGYPLCSLFAVTIIIKLTGSFGFSHAFLILGIVYIVMGIIMMFAVSDSPEDRQNASGKCLSEQSKKRTGIKMAELLRNPDIWKIGLAFGFLWMTTIGIISQMLPRMMQLGYDQSAATHFLQLASVCALFGSYFFGWLDQKIGTRKASLIYCAGYILVLLALVFGAHNLTAQIFAVTVGGFGTGAICNLLPSMIGSVFGREQFKEANGICTPLASLVRCCNFLILSLGLKINGSYQFSYLIFMFLCLLAFVLLFYTDRKR